MSFSAPPEARIPGWKIVAVLIVIGVVVLIPALFIRFSPRFGPPVLVLRVTDEIRATPESGAVEADLGPHCSPIHWDPAARDLTATTEIDFGGVGGVLLQRMDRLSANIVGTGFVAPGDLIRSTLAVDGHAWTLTSPVDDRVLATFVRSGENVTVGGSTYGPGDLWTLSFDYNVTTPSGTYRIEESLTLTNEGIVPPRITVPGACM